MGVNEGGCGAKWNIFNAQQRHWAHNFDLIYEQQERVFHWDIQTRENNGEHTSTKRECFCPLFSKVWISRWDMSSSCSYGFFNELRCNRMFWFADLSRISNQAYHNYRIRFVVDDKQ